MPANNTSGLVHWLAGKAPDSIGHLYTPNRAERPKSWLPYVLDNGAYAAAKAKRDFDWKAFWASVDKYCNLEQKPLWVACPDKPFEGIPTIRFWDEWSGELWQRARVPIALVVQDGMTPDLIPQLERRPDVIFVGGSTQWKWQTLKDWCGSFPRVHVGRVNGRKGLELCLEAGVESCDGTGWFRGNVTQIVELVSFIAEQHGLDRNECIEAAMSSRNSRHDNAVLDFEVSGE